MTRVVVLVTIALLCFTAVVLADIKFNRADWVHWATFEKKPCQNVRDAVLQRDAVTLWFPSDDPQGCNPSKATGSWRDPYSFEMVSDPSVIDIDHLVPLEWAHRHGGSTWSAHQRKAFANDLIYPYHLLATHQSLNRSKGSRGPAQWRPPTPRAWCAYAHAWSAIIVVWDLKPTDEDRVAIRGLLATCRREAW